MDVGDLKFVFAAWRMGKLDFPTFRPDLDDVERASHATEFCRQLHEFLVSNYHRQFALVANSSEGKLPVGFALLFQPHVGSSILIMGDIIWMPWASARNKLETVVHMMNALRRDSVVLEFSPPSEQPFWDHVCRYGVMRRVGTTFDIYAEPAATYQTRKAT